MSPQPPFLRIGRASRQHGPAARHPGRPVRRHARGVGGLVAPIRVRARIRATMSSESPEAGLPVRAPRRRSRSGGTTANASTTSDSHDRRSLEILDEQTHRGRGSDGCQFRTTLHATSRGLMRPVAPGAPEAYEMAKTNVMSRQLLASTSATVAGVRGSATSPYPSCGPFPGTSARGAGSGSTARSAS